MMMMMIYSDVYIKGANDDKSISACSVRLLHFQLSFRSLLYQSETHDDGDDDDDNDGDGDDGNHNNDDDVGYHSDIHHGCGKSVFVYF